MILVDTSVWVDHLRRTDAAMVRQLEAGNVAVHPLVIGEIACGVLPRRVQILTLLHELPGVAVASNTEALGFIEWQGLAGKGIGYVDVHLLASTMMTAGTTLWTRDKRLSAVASDLRLVHDEKSA